MYILSTIVLKNGFTKIFNLVHIGTLTIIIHDKMIIKDKY